MIAAAVMLAIVGVSGVLPFSAGASTAHFAHFSVPTWLTFLVLAVVTVSVSYPTGIAAARRLGARLASLIALTEVLAATVWAAALLDQIPSAMQLMGGGLVIAGVVAAKLGEARAAEPGMSQPGMTQPVVEVMPLVDRAESGPTTR